MSLPRNCHFVRNTFFWPKRSILRVISESFNMSIKEKIFLSCLKIGRATPIFKSEKNIRRLTETYSLLYLSQENILINQHTKE